MAEKRNWIEIQNAFYPYEPVPIPPDKLDAWYVERPRSPYADFLERLNPEMFPERYVLVGHRSSGKTTELIKLAAELRKVHDYFVVYLPLEYNLDISRVNPVEVLFLIGTGIWKVANDELEEKPDEKLINELVNSLTTLVQEETKSKRFSINIPELLKSVVCLGASFFCPEAALALGQFFNPFTFISGTDVQLVRKREIQPRIKEIADIVNKIIEEVEAKGNKPLILLVDGLDKVENEDLIKLNFLENPHLATIRSRTIYVGPMILYYGVPFASVRTRFNVIDLPNVMIHNRKREPADYETMQKMVCKRLGSLGYKPEEVISSPALDLLIRNSGGVARDLMFLFRQAAFIAKRAGENRIDESLARQAVADYRRKFEAALTPKYYEVLEKVAKSKRRTDDRLCDELIMGNFILSYIDEEGEIWFDVHSILWQNEG